MIIISHRGKLTGPDFPLENTQSAIRFAIREGFDVEIDVRTFAGDLWLGHDELAEIIDGSFLYQYRKNLWIHCKDLKTLEFMVSRFPKHEQMQYFFHDKDQYTMVSNGLIWAHPTSPIANTARIVSVLPELGTHSLDDLVGCYAICTDYPRQMKDLVTAYENCNHTGRASEDIQTDWEKFLECIQTS